MTAADFIEAMHARGLDIHLENGQVVAELEDGAVPPTANENRRLRELRAEIVATLSGTKWSRISLYQLDRVLEVAVPWSDVPLILAPGCRVASELRARELKPGRIWCCCEVIDLLLSGIRPEDAKAIAETKVLFNGAVIGVRREET